MRHVLRSQDFDRTDIESLFSRAQTMRAERRASRTRQLYQNLLCFNIFYEPSTRTRLSFATAAADLGMQVIGTENAKEFSSAAKGETVEDTIRVLCGYEPSLIIMRHNETGGADRAAAVSTVPIINAGDGHGQHPTQALLDLYTIQVELERVDGLSVVIGGDLLYGRTAHSLVYLLAKFDGVSISLVAPPGLEMDRDLLEYLERHGVPYKETDQLDAVLPEADVVYWTRIQKERLGPGLDYDALVRQFIIDQPQVELMKRNSIIMHPLPRVGEITTTVDSDPRAAYFRQAAYGVELRMALIDWVLQAGSDPPAG